MSSEPSSPRTPGGANTPALRQLGKYRIERQLGVGGMGTVYFAVDNDLKRTVALKVLPKDRATNPTLVRRFKSEGQAAAVLHHKNIVNVYEAGQADGYLFLALEYVDGVDVLEWMRKRGIIPVKRSLEIIRQVAEALQHAYEKNIVHRDIKPSNLMIARDGTVKLTDMGLARSVDDTLDTTITRDGTTVGTVDYMSPEQATNSKAADIRSDIYSLGCTWYHMLTGSPPYPDGSVTNKLGAHVSAPLPNPRTLNPKIPEAVVAVIHRMMAKKKEQRYQTPAHLIADLSSEGLLRGEAVDLLAMFAEEADSDNIILSLSSSENPSAPTATLPNAIPASDSGDNPASPAVGLRRKRKMPPVRRPTGEPQDQKKRSPTRYIPRLDGRGVLLILVMGAILVGVIMWSRQVQQNAPQLVTPHSPYAPADLEPETRADFASPTEPTPPPQAEELLANPPDNN